MRISSRPTLTPGTPPVREWYDLIEGRVPEHAETPPVGRNAERGEEAFRRAAVFVRGERDPEPARGGKGGAAGGVLLCATVWCGGVPVP